MIDIRYNHSIMA